MTGAQLQALIGRRGRLKVAEHTGVLHVPVKLTDAKSAWGNTRYEVTPVSGTGKAWVSSERVTLDPEKE